jgi:hypothetical protein
MHPEVEIRPILGAVPDADIYRGHEGAARWHADVFESWAEFRAEVEGIVDAGDERYVVLLRFIARRRSSGIKMQLRGAHLHAAGRPGLQAPRLRGPGGSAARSRSGLAPPRVLACRAWTST